MSANRMGVELVIVAALGMSQALAETDEKSAPATQPVKFADRFKGEPVRPKAPRPISFSDSLERAKAEARITGRRILLYFTGPGCLWCRELECRTFTDAEVAELSKNYVCVELKTDRDPTLADEFHVDSIPRSLLLTPEGTTIDQRIGYFPANEYALWLRAGLVKSTKEQPGLGK
jgi:thioredoxin-related protein